MRFNCKNFFAVCLILMSGLLLADPQPISIQMDAVAFRYDQRAAFVEIFYQINGEAALISDQQTWVCKLNLQVARNDSFWTESQWEHENMVADLDLSKPVVSQTGRVYFLAPDGSYTIDLTVSDPNLKISNRMVIQKEIKAFPVEKVAISEIELASSITYAQQDKNDHPFLKNGLMVIPQPSLTFGDMQPLLYYYAEIYHLNTLKEGSSPTLTVSIFDEKGTPVSAIPTRNKPLSTLQASVVEMGEIGLFALDAGSYNLRLVLKEAGGNECSIQEKRFYLHRKEPEKDRSFMHDETLFLQSPFADMSDKEIKEILTYTIIILSESEKQIVDQLKDDEAKRRYLFEYWIAKEKNPALSVYEEYFKFRSHISEVNNDFRIMGKPGWKTDRGRVYLKYGPPDDVDRQASTSDSNPYEVWIYESIEGGVEFVFADLSSYKDYTLIHSSKQGEVYNPDYLKIIERGY